jgi:hypothetical protein
MFILYSLNPRKQIFFNHARCFGVEICVKFAGMKLVTKATTFCFIELALILKNFDSLEGSYGSSKWFMRIGITRLRFQPFLHLGDYSDNFCVGCVFA